MLNQGKWVFHDFKHVIISLIMSFLAFNHKHEIMEWSDNIFFGGDILHSNGPYMFWVWSGALSLFYPSIFLYLKPSFIGECVHKKTVVMCNIILVIFGLILLNKWG